MTAAKKITILIITLILVLSAIPTYADTGMVILLDPGHGGSDNGSKGVLNGETFYERTLNNMVTEHLCNELLKYDGVKVYLTRHYNDNDSKPSLQTRGSFAGQINADLMISLHMNALDNAAYWGGTEIFVHAGTYLPDGAKKTTAIAKDILSRFEKYGLKDRGVKTRVIDDDDYYLYPNGAYADYYGIIRYAATVGVPAMIIEHGFMTNKEDLTFLSKSENLKKLAQETAAAVAKEYGLTQGTGELITLEKQAELTIGDLPTTLTVGDEISTLTASGGSGNGEIQFQTNDSEVLIIKENKLIAVGPGKANITAVRGSDGVYHPQTSSNYIRITVNEAATPTPVQTIAPTNSPTPTLSSTPTPSSTSTLPATSTPSHTQQGTTQPSTSQAVTVPTTTATPNENTENPTSSPTPKPGEKFQVPVSNNSDTESYFWIAVAAVGGILLLFVVVSVVLLIKNAKDNK